MKINGAGLSTKLNALKSKIFYNLMLIALPNFE